MTYDAEEPTDLERYAEIVVPTVRQTGLQLIVEPGRFMVGNAGVMITRVLYRKRSGGKELLVVDAGMTDLLRPSHYNAYHRMEAVESIDGRSRVDVVGPVCETVRRGRVTDRQRSAAWIVRSKHLRAVDLAEIAVEAGDDRLE